MVRGKVECEYGRSDNGKQRKGPALAPPQARAMGNVMRRLAFVMGGATNFSDLAFGELEGEAPVPDNLDRVIPRNPAGKG